MPLLDHKIPSRLLIINSPFTGLLKLCVWRDDSSSFGATFTCTAE